MKFHITITDNETNEIVHDEDTNAIIGAYGVEGGAYSIGKTACDGLTLLTVLRAANVAIEHCTQDNPLIKMLLTLEDKSTKADEPNDDTDN